MSGIRSGSKKKHTGNTFAIRIFRVMIGLAVVIAVFFSGTDAIYNIYMRNVQSDSIMSLTQDVNDGVLEPFSKIADQSIMSATEGNAKVIDLFFTNCKSSVNMTSIAAKRYYEADEKAQEVVMPPSLSDAESSVYRLDTAGFDETDPESRDALEVMSRLKNIMAAAFESNQHIASIYFASPAGFTIFADDQEKAALDEQGNPKTFDPTTRDWYTQAVNTKDIVFSSVKSDYFTGEGMVTCSMPVFSDQTLLGVVAIDIRTDTINKILLSNTVENSSITIIDGEGNVEISTTEDGLFGLKTDEQKNLHQLGFPTVEQVIADAAAGECGTQSLTIKEDGTELLPLDEDTFMELSAEEWDAYAKAEINASKYEIYYAPVPVVDWSVLFTADYTELNAQTNAIADTFIEQALDRFDENENHMRRALMVDVILLAVIILISYLIARMLSRRLSEPIAELAAKVREINGDHLDFSWDRQESDETAVLAESFAEMTEKIKHYIADLTTVTAEKERIGAELDVATKIQADMLPLDFPEAPELELFASMTPAKEVGGDFYDFFHIDDDHMGLVIADVSGKGVPAALFMVIAKTLIKNLAISAKRSPAQILSAANKLLCEGNEEMLFVTAWVGILTISSGEMTCANAGHEYPILKRKGEAFRLYEDEHDVALAISEMETYHEYEMTLHAGDILVLYTDGFPESRDEEDRLFTEDAMLDALNDAGEAEPKALDDTLRKKIRAFNGGAEQFDDMTMLTIRYHGCSDTGNDDGAETE